MAASIALHDGAGADAAPPPTAPPRAGPPAPATSATLRIATFNAWLIPIVSKDRGARLARMPSALTALDIDVLCLQEVWFGTDQSRLLRALRTTYPHVLRGGGGLMIFSKLKIVDSTWVAFPRYPGLSLAEQLAGKGLLEAIVETPAGRIRVVTSHLALAFGPGNPRTKQLAFLLRRLAKQRDLPLVLAADLNTWPVDQGRLAPDYMRLLQAGFLDVKAPRRDALGRYHPGSPTRIGWPRPARKPTTGWYPDHVLYRAGTAGKLALTSFRFALDERGTALSDHNLLCAKLKLTALPRVRTSAR